jgi:hypothetical protein
MWKKRERAEIQRGRERERGHSAITGEVPPIQGH